MSTEASVNSMVATYTSAQDEYKTVDTNPLENTADQSLRGPRNSGGLVDDRFGRQPRPRPARRPARRTELLLEDLRMNLAQARRKGMAGLCQEHRPTLGRAQARHPQVGLGDRAYISSINDCGGVSTTPSFALPGTLTAAMPGQTQVMNQTSAGQIILPVPMAAGATVPFAVLGTGVPTFVPATGATLVNRSAYSSAAGQYAFVVIVCIVGGAAPVYMLAGTPP